MTSDKFARDLGRRLRKAREARDWTQAELARRMGVTKGMIHRWESGGFAPNSRNLRKLCVKLRISTDHALGMASPRSPSMSRSPGSPHVEPWGPS